MPAKRALWIFGGIVACIAAIYLHQQLRCWHSFAIDSKLEVGHENCTLMNIQPLSLQAKRAGKSYIGKEDGMTFQMDSNGESGLLNLGQNIAVPRPAYVAVVPDFFRIHFTQPAKVEALPPEQFANVEAPRTHIYGPDYGDKLVAGWEALGIVYHWHPFHRFHSFGKHKVFREDGYTYESSAGGGGLEEVLASPGGDFIAMVVGDGDRDCAAFIEIFRRRDHRLLARIRVDSCNQLISVVVYNFAWVSERDFLYVTGFRAIDCFICRFER